MVDWRTIGLGVLVFCATFAVGWWSGLGNLLAPRRSDARSSPEMVAKVDTAAPVPGVPSAAAAPAPATVACAPAGLAPAPEWPGTHPTALTEHENLRKALVLRATAYRRSPCNRDAKTLYVNAASAYAEKLMRAAGCHGFPACGLSLDGLDRVWQANRTAGDTAVAEAVASISSAGGVTEKDFRGDIGRSIRIIRIIGNSEFRPGAFCDGSNSKSGGSSTWRVRLRLRR